MGIIDKCGVRGDATLCVGIFINLHTDYYVLQNTVNVVTFRWGKFHENVGMTFHVEVIFAILLPFPS